MAISLHDTKNLYYIPVGGEAKRSALMGDEMGDGIRQSVTLPNSSLSVVIEDNTIYTDFIGTASVSRLRNVCQLGTVGNGFEYGTSVSHNRFIHSLLGAVVGETVLAAANFPENEINLEIALVMLHDAPLPAYSDYGKLGAHTEMDEEANIRFVLDQDDVQQVLAKYHLSAEKIEACITGKYPFIGQLLNSHDSIDIDRISYMALDAASLVDKSRALDLSIIPGAEGPHFNELREKAAQYLSNNLFDIFQDIHFVNGVLAYDNPKRVHDFLMLRAHLYHDFYASPENRGREAAFSYYLGRLWEKGAVNRQSLLTMVDTDLDGLMRGEMPDDVGDALFNCTFSRFKQIAKFTEGDVGDIRRRYSERQFVAEHKSFNPVTKTPLFIGGKLHEFRKIYPLQAREIERMSRECAYVGVYEFVRDG